MRSEGKIELFNEDCMLTMKRIASGTVDLILTDHHIILLNANGNTILI
jgi:DNA modification methylase